MTRRTGTPRTCPHGHTYYKSSDCPVCPICESVKETEGFLGELAAPARRALEGKGITSLPQLSTYTEEDILALHGMGKSAISKLKEVLTTQGLSFQD